MITEIGAVKVRGGEVLGEFQTLVNPHADDPAVHRGAHRHHRLDGRRRARRSSPALPAFLEFAAGMRAGGPQRAVRRRLPQALRRAAGPARGRAFEVLDTARLARRVVTRDDAPNCKLSSLAVAFGSAHDAQPPGALRRAGHRRRAARADGAARRPRGAHARGAARPSRSRVSPAAAPQAAPRRAPAARPRRLPVPRRRTAACSTSARRRDLRTRVRSYFTASETRSRMGEMVDLADRVDRHRVRHAARGRGARAAPDRRAQAALQPALAGSPRRSLWLKLTVEPWPRLSLVRAGARRRRRLPRARSPRAAAAEKCAGRAPRDLPAPPVQRPACRSRRARRACALAEMGRCLSPVRRQRRRSTTTPRWSPRSATACCASPTRSSRRSPRG